MSSEAPEPLVLPIPPDAGLGDLDDVLARLHPNAARLASSFVLRMDSRLATRLASAAGAAERERLLRRARSKDVLVLFHTRERDAVRALMVGRDGMVALDAEEAIVRAARAAELRRLVADAAEECYFRAGDGYHFVTPAGVHCTHFLRLTDAVRSLQALGSITFWLRPKLAKVDGVLLDSWSTLGLLLNTLRMDGTEVVFDCLPGHPAQEERGCRATIRALERRIAPDQTLMVLTSVSSSGSLQDGLRRLLEEGASPRRVVFLSLFKFEGSDADALCELQETPENYPSNESCELCNGGSQALPIDPRVYYVRDRLEREVPLRARHWLGGRDFIDTFGMHEGAFVCHMDDPNDGRHHALAVDMVHLGRTKELSDEFIEVVARAGRDGVDVVVTPDHEAGRLLAAMAAQAHDAAVVVTNDMRRSTLGQEEVGLLEGARHLLVVDDVVNSGSRLEEFNTAIREDFEGAFERVGFAIGLARTESEEELASVVRSITMHHPWVARLEFAARVFLPRWGREECPWCREYEYLASISMSSPTPSQWITDRLVELSDTLDGVRRTPLLVTPGADRRSLAEGSLAGPQGLGEAPLLFAVASAVQALRTDTDPNDRLDPRFPVGNVSGLKNLKNYSEALIRMALLRLLTPKEWTSSNRAKVRRFLRNVTRRRAQRVLLGEMLLASARNAIAPLELVEYRGAFELSGFEPAGAFGAPPTHFPK